MAAFRPPHFRSLLPRSLTQRAYKDGEALIKMGERGDELYLIRYGKVRGCTGGQVQQSLKAGAGRQGSSCSRSCKQLMVQVQGVQVTVRLGCGSQSRGRDWTGGGGCTVPVCGLQYPAASLTRREGAYPHLPLNVAPLPCHQGDSHTGNPHTSFCPSPVEHLCPPPPNSLNPKP